MTSAQRVLAAAACAALQACSKTPPPPQETAPPTAPSWAPGTVYRTPVEKNARGLRDLRGLVHAHSIYSHDACDNQPRDDAGTYDQTCLDDFRRGMCQSKHDFIMLTDHPSSFTSTEFPATLLFRKDLGDRLVEHGAAPTANFAACPDGPPVLILAGTESGKLMPVGLERHVAEGSSGRRDLYNQYTKESVAAVKEAGGLVLLAHTEGWSAEEILAQPIDGFEMYNVHANLFLNMGQALELLSRVDSKESGLPAPDLALLPIMSEDPRYLNTWGTVLARGGRRVTTMGSDCHRNTFPTLMSDGERVDSYRRMMSWFANHLLTVTKPDGSYDDRDLKDALRDGRLYGVFELAGHPTGFEFAAREAGATREMGEQVSLKKGPRLEVRLPAVQGLDPKAEPPLLTARILRAKEEGWEVVAEGKADLSHEVKQEGAYRAEIRMEPRHLKAFLGRDAARLTRLDLPWIYANPIYVGP